MVRSEGGVGRHPPNGGRGSGDLGGRNGSPRSSPDMRGLGDRAYALAAFPLFIACPMPGYSPIAELSWGFGPSVGGDRRPVSLPGTAVVEAAGEGQAESGGLWGGRQEGTGPLSDSWQRWGP